MKPKSFENSPKLTWRERMRLRRVVHARLLSAVQGALPGIEVYSSPSQGIIAWKKEPWIYCFTVRPYDQFAWRLTLAVFGGDKTCR